ncbi:MAG: hypothetical protein K5898_12625 [Ruminococcus sp.]|uniref:hypothetical protein n=1 Tax=Ruminococcus sp. TaxID=41978 RepID=UPI0025FAF91F|nr:hypothetical protein [Ruminococcus sp.]MCR4795986.1 hypothetical protein [Ruminococcus sp.]
MRTIRELLGTDEKIWFYIENEGLWENFLEFAAEFRFINVPRDRWKFGHVIAVHKSGEMGHVPIFIWCMSFGENKSGVPAKYDFRKLIDGEEDISCKVAHFKGRIIC